MHICPKIPAMRAKANRFPINRSFYIPLGQLYLLSQRKQPKICIGFSLLVIVFLAFFIDSSVVFNDFYGFTLEES